MIQSSQELENWLSEYDWFEDSRVLAFSQDSSNGCFGTPAEVTLELAYQIEGNFRAFSRRVSRVFKFKAGKIKRYSLPDSVPVQINHVVQGIEIIEGEGPIAFRVDLPEYLEVVCEVIRIKQLPDLVDTVAPRLQENEISVKASMATAPTPEEWLTLFREQNQEVAWHTFGGIPTPAEKVPQSGYEGWFLQIPGNLDRENQGIFFFSFEQRYLGFSFKIENQGGSEPLWQAARVILGKFSGAEIHCGNCHFTASQWMEFIKNPKKFHDLGE